VPGHALLAVTGLAGIAVLLAGCGGSTAPPVADLATTSAGAGTAGARNAKAQPSQAAFAACMTSHGFAASVGGGSGQIQIAGVRISAGDPGSSQFQSAMQACRKYLPGGGPPEMTPEQRATWAAGLARFAGCIRRNGVPSFPGPDSDGRLPLDTLAPGFFLTSAFEHAYADCKSRLPSGPGLPHIALP
jgi:hypothetical protein